MVLLKKVNMGADKPIPVVILPPVMFIGGPKRHRITGIAAPICNMEPSRRDDVGV